MAERDNREDKAFSLYVSDTLDCMGYNSSIVNDRRQLWKESSKHGDHLLTNPHRSIIVAGSKGEGLTTFFESDIDNMRVFDDVICIEDAALDETTTDKTVFQLDMVDTYPGYARLRLIRQEKHQNDIISSSLFETAEQQMYLSSDALIEHFIKIDKDTYTMPRSGPADRTEFGVFSQDLVPSLPCRCPSILNSYLTRRRPHGWPSLDMLQEISDLDGHVVAVGFKKSPRRPEEWRMCFTQAELAMINTFNDAKTKLLLLLKFIAKDVLNPIAAEITSYLMKNLCLWMCELTPGCNFKLELLTKLLRDSLKLLCIFLKHNFFPNYMIAKRDLLYGKLNMGQRRKLISKLTELIDEGPCMLFRCDRLGLVMTRMYTTPEVVRQEGEVKDRTERLFLLLFNMELESRSQGISQSSLECMFGMLLMVASTLADGLSEVRVPGTVGEAMSIVGKSLTNILS